MSNSKQISNKGIQCDQGKENDCYRVNVAISQLTKEEALQAKRMITIILQKTLINYEFFNEHNLIDINAWNERTRYYTNNLDDKY